MSNTTTIHDKLVKIQAELKAPKGQRNNFGNYNYRSCEDVLSAIKPLLEKEGLVIILTDEIVNVESRFYVKAVAKITNGKEEISTKGFAREEENKKGMDGSQITGASSSYARKYALNGLFAIDDAKDSDTTNTGATSTAQASTTPPKNDLAPWFDVKNAAHGKIVIVTHEQTKLLGEPLVKKLREQFKISKVNAEALTSWKPKT